MSETVTPRAIADKLKATLYPPRPGAETDFTALVHRFTELCSSGPADIPDTSRAQNEMANHLLILAGSRQDKSLIKTALYGLLNAGRLGRQAACRFLRSSSISLEQLAPMVAELPMHLRMHLLQELLRTPQEEDKNLMQWARQQLTPLGNAPIKDILAFLEECHLAGGTPVPLLRQTILSGHFPDWFKKTLATQLSSASFTALCRAANALGWQPAISRLATCLTDTRLPPDAEDVRLLAGAGNQADPALCKAFQQLLASRDEAAVLAGAEGLARIAWPKTGKAFALVYKKFPPLRSRLAIKATLLPQPCLMRFLRTLTATQRADMVAQIFATMARMDPDFMLDRIARASSLTQAHSKELQTFIKAQKKEALNGLKRRVMPKAPDGPASRQKTGLVRRLLAGKKQTLNDALETAPNPKDKELPGSEFSSALTSRTLSRLALPNSSFFKAQFIKVTFSAIDFTGSTFNEVDFTGCTFSNCLFTTTLFFSTTFSDCQFKNCAFTSASFADCSWEEGRMDRCFFSGALQVRCTLSRLRLRHVSFNLCQLQKCTLTSCHMECTALAHAQFLDCTLAGTELTDCSLSHTLFMSTQLSACSFERTCLAACSMPGSSSDVGSFEQARLADIIQRSAALEMRPVTPPHVAKEQSAVLLSIVDLFSRRLDILRQHAPLLLNNQRRLEHSARRMTGQDCFGLVPYLLHSDIMDQKFQLDAPPCRIAGYTPNHTQISLAQRYFKGIRPTSPGTEPVIIQGLYAMGSLGSVAQTHASDVDYWVCHDGSTASLRQLQGLRAKLDAITSWAMGTFGLEVYFFLMSMDDVRANDFGLSDKESSGSAQALLLKEEFYRTVVPIAGGHPAWWATPPGVSPKDYAAWLRAAQTMPRPGASCFVDMGCLTPIPQNEYFGASLWQIVKGLYAPYKSVMKLGLLEKYSAQPEELMLADQIKQSLTRGQSAIQHTDPYVVLYRQLRDYYHGLGDKKTVQLLTEALLLKAEVGEFDFFFGFPSTFEEQGLLDFLFGAGKVTEGKVKTLGKRWTFAKSLQIGSTVSQFMTSTYKRIQGKLDTGKPGQSTQARITPEDMTRMGRQIAANFARKKHKIMRVPFLGTRGYSELRFSAEKAPGKATVWAVQGRTRGEGKKSAKNAELLHKASSPITLLAWLVMNRLFTPKTLVDGDSSIAPMSVVDIKNALQQLHAFFPHDATFDLEPNEYLTDERVTRVMLLVNLTQPPEATKIYHVDIVYATNHGEVFSMPVPKPDAGILKSVRLWLSSRLPQDALRIKAIRVVYPKRGQCPRLPED